MKLPSVVSNLPVVWRSRSPWRRRSGVPLLSAAVLSLGGYACGGNEGQSERTERVAQGITTTNVLVSPQSVSALITFTTDTSVATTVFVFDAATQTQSAVMSEPQATTSHVLMFPGLLMPSTNYEFRILVSSTGAQLATGNFPTQPLAAGTIRGCGPSATETTNTVTGLDTCLYTVSPPTGSNAQVICTLDSKGVPNVGFSYVANASNAGFTCPPGSAPSSSGTTNFCLFNGDFSASSIVPQSYENPNPICIGTGAPGSQVGYSFTPHDPVIGPIVASLVSNYGNNQPTAGWSVGVKVGARQDFYSFGTVNANTGQPVNRKSIFTLASISKTFTGALLARFATDPSLAHYGVSLGTTVDSIAPAAFKASPSDPRATITLEEAANFTAGFDDNGLDSASVPNDVWAYYQGTTLVASPPGVFQNYSNAGIGLLGRAIEQQVLGPNQSPSNANRASSWEQLLHTYVTDPLALGDTQTIYPELPSEDADFSSNPNDFTFSADQQSRVAMPHQCSGTIGTKNLSCQTVCYNSPCNGTVTDYQAPRLGGDSPNTINMPAGSIWSTADDLMRWLSFHMGHQLGTQSWITPQLLQAMRPSFPSSGQRSGGLGWGDPGPGTIPMPILLWPDSAINGTGGTVPCAPLIQKDGSMPGLGSQYIAQSTMAYQPDLDIGAFALSNDGQNSPEGLVEQILYDLGPLQKKPRQATLVMVAPVNSPKPGWSIFGDTTIGNIAGVLTCYGWGTCDESITGSTANLDPTLPTQSWTASADPTSGNYSVGLKADTAGLQTITLGTPIMVPAPTITVQVHPRIDLFGPGAGLAAGGQTLTIQGGGFAQGGRTVVTFNGAAIPNVSISSDGTTLSFPSPAGNPGSIVTVVAWVDGVPSLPQTFSYCEPITSCYLSQACNTTIFDGCSNVQCGADLCEADGGGCNASHNCCPSGKTPDGTGGCVCAPHRCPKGTAWDDNLCGCAPPY